MSTCDVCGNEENMPYQCRHCGGTFCAEHRLPESHNCPGLENWNDNQAVFDSGFEETVESGESSGGVADRLGVNTGPGSWASYFRNNMTYVFLGAMWVTFLLQYVVGYLLTGTLDPGLFSRNSTWEAIFVLSSAHPEYIWTWITSIFSHGGFGHIAINSIVIYFFGRLVEDYVGSKQFTILFLVSGALAGLGQILIGMIQTPGVPSGVVGASGAGLAIMGVLTILNPGLRVYLYFIIPVPLWLLTVGYVGISVLGIFGPSLAGSNVANVAHLVGLLIGLAYGYRVKDQVRMPNQLQFGAGGGPGGPGGPGGGGGRRRGPF
ncbi:rhomboid family intramembrane serine protease [Salinibaculum rarum]|uniref:rhomboid family intramembrane serine protease n=1 Tax=Salinibaculum rarum TaxID=3058903 RepID=UPI00265DE6C7|nr:rhomboid family intramembrane serine protease [Salinibaculum sp. KK48]